MKPVGIVLGTKPSNPLEFWVGVERGSFLQLDDVVVVHSEVDGTSRRIRFYGLVHEVQKHLEGVELAYEARLVTDGIVPASIAYVAKITVTRIEPEVFVPPTPGDPVFKAEGEELDRALYYDGMRCRIPAGLSRSGEVVYLNYDFLNGREGAHVSISGMSGVATKTSYALFLLYAIFQKADDRNRIHGLIFNVKGKDLLWIDRRNRRFGGRFEEEFRRMDLDPRPFANVGFFAPPERPGSDVPATRDRLEGVNPYRWSMKEFAQEGLLRFLFAEGDEGTSSLHYVIDRVTEKLQQLARNSPHEVLTDESGREIDSLDRLREMLQEVIEDRESRADTDRYREWFGTAATSTAYAFLRRFHHAAVHCRSLIHGDQSRPIDWRRNQLTVIDISDLHGIAKMFVVGSILKRVFREKEESGNPYPKIFVVLDELNKYAPKDRWSPIKDILLDIAERGRSLGVILIGAQQTASEVEKRIVANAAVKVTGRLDSSEVLSKEYEFLTGNFRQRAIMLKKGSMILYQPDIPNPLMITFPLGPWATKKEEAVEEVHVPEEFDHF
ncbi:MAG TPA: ATP-binding protein [Aquifex aeolicus]|uniref:ATP-binding protein n=1 Tax=Aquifex aeolicus TaxID=63363 RepID=A0A7C5Q9P6_AQUAO|nr:ATP-binding protein [Aquifex aeolicus]